MRLPLLDNNVFVKFVKENPFLKTHEIGTNFKVTPSIASKYLKRNGMFKIFIFTGNLPIYEYFSVKVMKIRGKIMFLIGVNPKITVKEISYNICICTTSVSVYINRFGISRKIITEDEYEDHLHPHFYR
jgi:predicted transcriptional regulator